MDIKLNFDAASDTAPGGFLEGMRAAADILGKMIRDPITVTINVGWGNISGSPIPSGVLAEGGPGNGIVLSYGDLVSQLQAHGNAAAQQALKALPSDGATQLSGRYYVTTSQQKAWGLLAPDAPVVDGVVGFSSVYPYAFNPIQQAIPGQFSLISAALHELTHAMGRIGDDGALDLSRYTAPGVLAKSNETTNFFSLDGGKTNLAQYDSSTDPGDWIGSNINGDCFALVTAPGVVGGINHVDALLLGAMGFAAASQFNVITYGRVPGDWVDGTPYKGPVEGIQTQLLLLDPAAHNVTSYTPNAFIATGSGLDGIDVSLGGGNNILDGGGGSNFLIGGAFASASPTSDIFYTDGRNITDNVWSTLKGLHTGDSATVWGVTAADFKLTWLDNEGAAGADNHGLTAVFTKPGQAAQVGVTFAGLTPADLAAGHLATSFGRTNDLPGLPGSSYFHAQVV